MEQSRIIDFIINIIDAIIMKFKSKKLFKKIFFKLYSLLTKLPLDENLIVFESFIGRKYNDNPKVLFEHVKKDYPEYTCIWIVNDTNKYSIEGAIQVRRLSFRYFLYVSRAKYIINNSRMPHFFKKRKEQIFLQTWHGTPLKRLAHDMEKNVMPQTDKEKYLKNFSNDVKNWDILISPNTYATKRFKTAFKVNEQILEVGYPRNESLYEIDTNKIEKLKAKYNIKPDEKVVLYTPTYRDNNNEGTGVYKQEIALDLKMLSNIKNIKVLLRLHYLVSQDLNLNNYQNIIDVSDVNDINELYIISDALLNDYSSTMFDYLILEKPLILFPYDLEEYTNDIRGFYMDYNKLPGEIIESTERLIEIIENLELYSQIWKDDLIEFKEKMEYFDETNSSKEILNILLNK